MALKGNSNSTKNNNNKNNNNNKKVPAPARNLRCSCCGAIGTEIIPKLFCRGRKQERLLHNYSFPSPPLAASSPSNWGLLQGSYDSGNMLLQYWPRGHQLTLETLECVQNQCWAAQPHFGKVPAHGSGLGWDLRSLPTKTTPWFCDFPATLKLEAGPGHKSVTRANVTENTILHAALESGTRGSQIEGNLSCSPKFMSNFLSPACHSVMDEHPNLRQTWSKGALLSLMKTHCHWAWFKEH